MPHQIQKLSPKRNLVIANQINESRFKMTRAEQKLILYCIGMIDNKDGRIERTFEMDIKDFADFLEIKRKDFHREMQDMTADFAGRVFEIKLPDGRLRQITALSMVEYYQGKVKLKVNQELAPFLLEMKSKFTRYSLQEVLKFKSGFAMRLYQLLAQYQYKNGMEYSIENLRFCLNVEEGKLRRYNDFKRFVLEPARKEINQKSSLKFHYEEIKTGRKVTSIRFIVTQVITPEIETESTSEVDTQSSNALHSLRNTLRSVFNFSDDQLDQLTRKHASESLKNALDVVRYNQEESQTPVKKPKSLFYDVLKNPDKYDLFPIEDKRIQEQKAEEAKRAEEEKLKQEQERQEQQQSERELKGQMIQSFIDLNPEDYQQLKQEALEELKEKNQFMYKQIQKLAKKKNLTQLEALETSPFTQNLAKEKLWNDILKDNVVM